MIVVALHTFYLVLLLGGIGSPQLQLTVALAGYAAYVVNAAQFIWKLRLARIVRLMRFLPDARVLLLTVTRATPAVVSMAVLTILVIFVYAVIGWSLFGAELPEQWGDVGTAMLTLFVLLTLENFPNYLYEAQAVNPVAPVFFLSFVLIAAFIVVNLLIGIIISSMDQARDEEAKRLRATGVDHLAALVSRVEEMHDVLNEIQAELEAVGQDERWTAGPNGQSPPKDA